MVSLLAASWVVVFGGVLGGVLGRLTSGLLDDDAPSPGGGSWENLAGSLGAGGGCIGADVAEVCGGTPGLLLAIFGLPPIGGGGGGGGKFFLTLPPTVDIVPRYCPPT